MAITIKKKYAGQDKTDTLSGNLRIETGNNRLVIYNGTREVSVVDETGFDFTNTDGSRVHIGLDDTGSINGISYYNTSGSVMATSDGSSTVYYDATIPRIVIGQSPDDGRIGIWVSKPGISVITELGG